MRRLLVIFAVFLSAKLCCACSLAANQKATTPPTIHSPLSLYAPSSEKGSKKELKLRGIPLRCQLNDLRKNKVFSNKFTSVANIAIAYAEAKDYRHSFEILETLEERRSRNRILGTIAITYANEGQYDMAFKVIKGIYTWEDSTDEDRDNYFALIKVAEILAAHQKYEKSVKLVDQIHGDVYSKAFAMASVATEMANAGQEKIAIKLLKDALEIIEKSPNFISDRKDQVIVEIIIGFLAAHRVDEALNEYQRLFGSEYKIAALNAIGVKYADLGNLYEAKLSLSKSLIIAQSMPEYGQWKFPIKARELAKVSTAYLKIGALEKSISIIRLIKDKWEQHRAFLEIAVSYIESGESSSAAVFLEKTLQIANRLESDSRKVDALVEIADQYAKIKPQKADALLHEVLHIVKTSQPNLEKPDFQSYNMERIARMYIAMGNPDKAVQVADMLQDQSQKNNLIELFECALVRSPIL
jgi:tetratricopeptide (TPR) repeat protein